MNCKLFSHVARKKSRAGIFRRRACCANRFPTWEIISDQVFSWTFENFLFKFERASHLRAYVRSGVFQDFRDCPAQISYSNLNRFPTWEINSHSHLRLHMRVQVHAHAHAHAHMQAHTHAHEFDFRCGFQFEIGFELERDQNFLESLSASARVVHIIFWPWPRVRL